MRAPLATGAGPLLIAAGGAPHLAPAAPLAQPARADAARRATRPDSDSAAALAAVLARLAGEHHDGHAELPPERDGEGASQGDIEDEADGARGSVDTHTVAGTVALTDIDLASSVSQRGARRTAAAAAAEAEAAEEAHGAPRAKAAPRAPPSIPAARAQLAPRGATGSAMLASAQGAAPLPPRAAAWTPAGATAAAAAARRGGAKATPHAPPGALPSPQHIDDALLAPAAGSSGGVRLDLSAALDDAARYGHSAPPVLRRGTGPALAGGLPRTPQLRAAGAAAAPPGSLTHAAAPAAPPAFPSAHLDRGARGDVAGKGTRAAPPARRETGPPPVPSASGSAPRMRQPPALAADDATLARRHTPREPMRALFHAHSPQQGDPFVRGGSAASAASALAPAEGARS
jgi:hypothetical protein